jgi:hypothetical protein
VVENGAIVAYFAGLCEILHRLKLACRNYLPSAGNMDLANRLSMINEDINCFQVAFATYNKAT